MTMGVRVATKSQHEIYDKEVRVFETETPDNEARFAMAFIERWGMVAAMPDGEDSSGRAKVRLATPDELVDRAFKTARIAFVRARIDGLMVQLPDLNEVNAEGDAALAKKKNKEEAY